MSRKRKGQPKTSGRVTPSPRTLPEHVAAAGEQRRTEAHRKLAKPIADHLDLHGVWRGVLHGQRVTIRKDRSTGAITHTNHGRAGR